MDILMAHLYKNHSPVNTKWLGRPTKREHFTAFSQSAVETMVAFWALSGGVKNELKTDCALKSPNRNIARWVAGRSGGLFRVSVKGTTCLVLECFCFACEYFAPTGGIHQVILMRQMVETLETALRLPEELVQS